MSPKLSLLLVWCVAATGCGQVATPPTPNRVAAAPQSSTSNARSSGSASASVPIQAGAASGSTVDAILPPDWPHRKAVAVRSTQAMVVTDSSIATQIGRDILSRNGNAFDAAVAVAFALAVAYPTAGNLGGGGFAVTWSHGEARALDFREVAPRAGRRDMFVNAPAESKAAPATQTETRTESRVGIQSVAVPGTVAGLWELHQQLGSRRLTWAELIEPAIGLARWGFVVDAEFARSVEHAATQLRRSQASLALFFPDGAAQASGSTFRNPDLALVLRRIAERGKEGFYRGATAKAIIAQMRRDHGLITQADLDTYVAKWREPLRFSYRGMQVTSMPPPSSGGVTLAMICHILEAYDLRQLGFQSSTSLHLMFEAMRRAFAARNAKLGDPDFVRMPLDELLGSAWADAQRATIERDRATPSTAIESAAETQAKGMHTTHFSVVDGEGNAIALTTTLNWWYGSGVTVAGAGFLLNNEMDDFASVPGSPNGYGLVQGEPNAIAPGKRMLSSMSPTIVTGPDGQVRLIAGAAGGPTIITSVFEEISNVLDYELDTRHAVLAPRFHMQHLPDTVTIELGGLRTDTRQTLESMGYSFSERPHIADAPMIGREGNEWVGVAEPRRAGARAMGLGFTRDAGDASHAE